MARHGLFDAARGMGVVPAGMTGGAAPAAPVATLPVSVAWLNPVSGDWDTAADWSTGTVPSVFSSVTIGQAGAYTVTVDAFSAAYGVSLSGAGATLLVGGGAGTLTVGTTLSVSAGTLEVSNTGSVAAGYLTIGAGGVLAGQGTIDAVITDSGSIALTAGVLVLEGGGSLGGAISGTGTLALAGGAYTAAASVMAGAAYLALDGSATLTLSGSGTLDGPISVGGSAELAAAASSSVTLAGDVTFGLGNGVYNGPGGISAGTLTTSGTTLINQYVDTASEPEAVVNGTWINVGTVYDLGDVAGTGTILNQEGGSFYLFDDQAGFGAGSGTPGTLSNAGTLAKTSGNGTATVNWSVFSTGLIYVIAGDLSLQGGGMLGGSLGGTGTLSLGGNFGATLQVLDAAGVPDIQSYGELTISGASGTLTGPVSIGGMLSAAAGTDVAVSGSLLAAGITLGGPGTITLGGAYSSQLLYLGAGANVTNAGTLTASIQYAGTASSPVTIDNLKSATLAIASITTEQQNNAAGTLINAGTLTTTFFSAQIATVLKNTGLVEITSGNSLTLTGGGTLGGTFSGGTLVLNDKAFSSTPAALGGLAAVAIYSGATLDLNGSGETVGISNITGNGGYLTATGGTLTFLGAIDNEHGNIDAGAYSVVIDGNVSGKGVLRVAAGGHFSLLDGAGPQQIAEFLGNAGQYELANPLDFAAKFESFGGSATIDLLQTGETGYNFNNGVLTVVNGSSTVAALSFAGSYDTGNFSLTPDGHGGTLISYVA